MPDPTTKTIPMVCTTVATARIGSPAGAVAGLLDKAPARDHRTVIAAVFMSIQPSQQRLLQDWLCGDAAGVRGGCVSSAQQAR